MTKMTWSVPAANHEIFGRNPLVAVVAELRFQPVLQLMRRVPAFQDAVRGAFPSYDPISRQVVAMGPAGPVNVRPEELHAFGTLDGSATLTLSSSSLTIEVRRHAHREVTLAALAKGLDALHAVCGDVAYSRLGLRYVNVIDRVQIGADLQRPFSWSELITSRFLQVPTELADLDGTFFASEVTSRITEGGSMTVRHGLLPDALGRPQFRVDIDRFDEDVARDANVLARLRHFADDIFAAFRSAAGPALLEWMRKGTV